MSRLVLSLPLTVIMAAVCGCAGATPVMQPRAAEVMTEAHGRHARHACTGELCLHWSEAAPPAEAADGLAAPAAAD